MKSPVPYTGASANRSFSAPTLTSLTVSSLVSVQVRLDIEMILKKCVRYYENQMYLSQCKVHLVGSFSFMDSRENLAILKRRAVCVGFAFTKNTLTLSS